MTMVHGTAKGGMGVLQEEGCKRRAQGELDMGKAGDMGAHGFSPLKVGGRNRVWQAIWGARGF